MYPTPEEIPTELVGPFGVHMIKGVDMSTLKPVPAEELKAKLEAAAKKEEE